jgi:hypothetical protein
VTAAPLTTNASPTPFVIGFDEDENTYGTRWALRIYTEAFRRLGIPLKPAYYQLARRAAMLDEGAIDGDSGRVYGYVTAHPNLIRVEEPVMDFSFGLFSANPSVRPQRLEDLASSGWRTEYRRGIFLCETTLKKFVPPELISDVTSEEQGVKKLLAGRTDLYCDLDSYVRKPLNELDPKNKSNVRKVINIGTIPTYPYIHNKHIKLLPRLTAVLKEMKAEGLIETYRLQTEREMGWTQQLF